MVEIIIQPAQSPINLSGSCEVRSQVIKENDQIIPFLSLIESEAQKISRFVCLNFIFLDGHKFWLRVIRKKK